MEEIWKDIEGYERMYQVSNMGNVRSLNYNQTKEIKVLKPSNNRGYKLVVLSKNGKTKTYSVHKLVATHFIPNPNSLPIINHIDEDKTNNCVSNLEWCTQQYNINYGNRNKKVGHKLSKPIIQLTPNNEIVKKWDGLTVIKQELGFNEGNISMCANGKRKTAYGYIWKYEGAA